MLARADAFRLPVADGSIHCAVISPPYWMKRDYRLAPIVIGGDSECAHAWRTASLRTGKSGSLVEYGECGCGAFRGHFGYEPTVSMFVAHLVLAFSECWRVLRSDGTLWVNIGDTRNTAPGGWRRSETNFFNRPSRDAQLLRTPRDSSLRRGAMCLIPQKFAVAMQEFGWMVISDNIYFKLNGMIDTARNRPGAAHEHVLMFAKTKRHYYDRDAVRRPASPKTQTVRTTPFIDGDEDTAVGKFNRWLSRNGRGRRYDNGADLRDVWPMAINDNDAIGRGHFARFPPKLPEICIACSTPEVGCCAECGTPYRRVVEIVGAAKGRSFHPHSDDMLRGLTLTAEQRDNTRSGFYSRTTVAWEKRCDCATFKRRPAIVLDPFVGSGTTVATAARMGRAAIGCDLSMRYLVEKAGRRVERTGLLFSNGVR